MKRTFLLISIMMVALSAVGCQNNSPSLSGDKVYPFKGKVTAVNAAANQVTIDHEEIPGLMKAMKMSFTVADARLLEGITPGVEVEGKVTDKHIITALKQRGTSDAADQKKIQTALAQLPAADRNLAEEQRLCPISSEPLGSMDTPVKLSIKGETVFICCKSCKTAAEKNADETLKKVAVFKEKNKD